VRTVNYRRAGYHRPSRPSSQPTIGKCSYCGAPTDGAAGHNRKLSPQRCLIERVRSALGSKTRPELFPNESARRL
jgi:hypothetical protein